MRGITSVLLVCGLFLAIPSPARPPTARAELIDGQGRVIGVATLRPTEAGVEIELRVAHLPPGWHALHIHEHGVCEPPDFVTAGGHFNPYGKKHGRKNPEGHHAGDLPNFLVKSDGTAQITVVANQVTLGEGPQSLFKPGGTALVIHAGPDDEVSDPAGNAGARLACGVIRRSS